MRCACSISPAAAMSRLQREPSGRSTARSSSRRTSTARAASTVRRCHRRSREPLAQNAVDFMLANDRGEPAAVTLVPTGPLTNIALLLTRTGGANVDRIVLMGGAIAEGNMTPAAEFNIWADPEAAAGSSTPASTRR